MSLKTTYRLAVMGVTLAIVVMGWRLYGPPATQVKSIALRAIEQVEKMLRPSADEPAAQPAGLKTAPAVSAAPPLLEQAPVLGTETSRIRPQSPTSTLDSSPLPATTPIVTPASGNDRLQALLARLTALDVEEPEVVPWGTSGKLYRCCCRATWGQSPQFSKHFESVAAAPEAAVEQVLAQVDAWRASEQTR